jgi:hypothetical protein
MRGWRLEAPEGGRREEVEADAESREEVVAPVANGFFEVFWSLGLRDFVVLEREEEVVFFKLFPGA